MKIGIIGAGDIGSTLGKAWAKRGHQIMFGIRNPESLKAKKLLSSQDINLQIGNIDEAINFGEVIVLAVPWEVALEIVKAAPNL
jgi:predicted dinucleotide-binding enzyme